MKKLIKILFGFVGIVIFGIIIMFSLHICPPSGPWPMPPWCERPEIDSGVITKANFFLSIPRDSEGDVFLNINGDKILMEKIGELSYFTTVNVLGQEELSYDYNVGDKTASYKTKIIRKNMNIDDGFSVGFKPDLKKNFTIGMIMFDTWGRNYNFNMIENTRNNIESSFERLARLGIKQTAVTYFLRPVYEEKDYNYSTTKYTFEDGIFSDDFRDEAMTDKDMQQIVKIAHDKGIKIGVEVTIPNIEFGKYMGSSDITNELATDQKKLAKDKTEKWVVDYLNKKEKKFLELAKRFDTAGFDYMMVNARANIPLAPYQNIENEKTKELIEKIKKETSIEVDAYVRDWQIFDEEWNQQYDFYNQADKFYIYMDQMENRYKPSAGMTFDVLKEKFSQEFADMDRWSEQPLNLIYVGYSYDDAVLGGAPEISDVKNPKIQALKADYQYQADVYESIMQAIEGKNIDSVLFFGYWWDDALDPKDTTVRISTSFSPRNKYAEGVLMKWNNALQ